MRSLALSLLAGVGGNVHVKWGIIKGQRNVRIRNKFIAMQTELPTRCDGRARTAVHHDCQVGSIDGNAQSQKSAQDEEWHEQQGDQEVAAWFGLSDRWRLIIDRRIWPEPIGSRRIFHDSCWFGQNKRKILW